MGQITFSTTNTLVSDDELSKVSGSLDDYTEKLKQVWNDSNYTEYEGSINLSKDGMLYDTVRELGDRFKSESLKYILVIGIGGSNLGTMAIYNALRRQLDYLKDNKPKLIFVETVSSSYIRDLQEILNSINSEDEIVINVISKSGGTTETIGLFELLYKYLEEKLPSIKNRIIVTSDDDSKLHFAAIEKGIPALAIPKKVGGRFSVFSAVGLLPLYLAGIDIEALSHGAKDLLNRCLVEGDNIALKSAAITFIQREKGIRINNNFFFNIELEYVGRWYRQLMGESVGKEKDINGNSIHEGITPIVTIGSTDLHSLAQLYLGGPNDKLTQFVYHNEDNIAPSVPSQMLFPGLVESIGDKKLSTIMDAIIGGVKNAYIKGRIPFSEVSLDMIDPYTIANYLQYKMLEMMYLGKLLNVNTFDQPNVEDYKKETRNLLQQD